MNPVLHRFLSFLQRLRHLDRMEWSFAVFVCFGIYILWTTLRYTVLEYEYYRGLADRQHTMEVTDPVSRGTIFSSNDPEGIFAMSTSLPDLAVDPMQVGSKERLSDFVSDIITDELCVYDGIDKCYDNLRTFLKVTEIPDYDASTDFARKLVHEAVSAKIHQEYITREVLATEVSPEVCKTVGGLGLAGVSCDDNGTVAANPLQITNPDSAAQTIAPLVGWEEIAMAKRLVPKKVRYIRLYRRLNLRSKEKIDERIANEKNAISKGLLEEKDAINPFIILESHPTRFYPEHSIVSKISGFVDRDNRGRYGIEGYFDKELRGRDGLKVTKKDAKGRAIGTYDLDEQDIVDGVDIKLTIDRNIQKEVSKLLEESIKKFQANKGTIVVMNPVTGAVLAMADYPMFDANNFGSVYDIEKLSPKELRTADFDFLGKPLFVEDSETGTPYTLEGEKILLRPATDVERTNVAVPKYRYKNDFGPGTYVNDAIGSLYEPGSVFKAITVAIGLETGDITPTDTYTDKGFVTIDNFKIKNVDSKCIGVHTYLHALNWSCNVGMISIVEKIGRALFYKYIQDFGFGTRTNITLEGEVYGRIDPYEQWSRAKLFTMSFGQGITATPLQMATAYSVLANGGVYMEPYIVDSVKLPSGVEISHTPKKIRRVISEETSKKIIAMLVEWVRVGFAQKGGVAGYDVAGKTGTSQIANKGGYEVGTVGHTITSFGGFAPAKNPKFVVIVKVDRPRTAVYSESTSSMLFQHVTDYLLNYYRVPKNELATSTESNGDE